MSEAAIIDGKAFAAGLRARVARQVAALKADHGLTPGLAVVLVGADLSGRRAIVLGRSNLVGKPIAQMLLRANATVTMAHSRTDDLPAECRRADIVVAAVGKPEMVRGGWIKHGAVVIDVGINRIPRDGGGTRVVGDVCFAEAKERAAAITPVPGGVGPMTIATLLHNTVIAACRQAGVEEPKV